MTRTFTSGLALFIALTSLVLAGFTFARTLDDPRAAAAAVRDPASSARIAELAEGIRTRGEELAELRGELDDLRELVARLERSNERQVVAVEAAPDAGGPELAKPILPETPDDGSTEFLLRRKLLDDFHTLDRGDREDALEELANLARWGDEEALALIVASLGDSSADVRRRALKELEDLDRANLAAHLGQVIADPSAKVREVVATHLTKLPASEAGPLLIGMLGDPDEDVVEQAIASLDKLDYAEAIPKLREQLAAEDLDLAVRAADALAELGDETAVAATIDRILRALESADVSHRIDHVKRLRRLGAVKPLTNLLDSDPSLAVRDEARKALARLED